MKYDFDGSTKGCYSGTNDLNMFCKGETLSILWQCQHNVNRQQQNR